MRAKLTFTARDGEGILLPLHYNHLLQHLIYHLLPPDFAENLHEEGFRYGKRRFKLFTFSRILQKGHFRKVDGRRRLFFPHGFSFCFATPRYEILENLIREALLRRSADLLGQEVFLSRVEVCPEAELREAMFLRFLAPVTVYRTTQVEGKRRTHFFSPTDSEFNQLLLENARKKYFLVTGKSADELKFAIHPYRFSPERNKAVVLFKGTPIVGWTGVFKVEGDPELLEVVYQTGLGNKNSAGFGMWEVWEDKREKEQAGKE
ncbi:CRISPR-associated endoribonuclease Cas6 [Atrimonas thermophila]|uniref:CRISPR-associated endoribonuclease Cas6 n=1 Tax=Atrimonas thermophila TaxID=3064161 RepID=UPI00399CB131